jgi:hypothetical protein
LAEAGIPSGDKLCLIPQVRGVSVNQFRLTDLRKFTRYDVTLAAFNGVGIGPQSAVVTATTQEGGMHGLELCVKVGIYDL